MEYRTTRRYTFKIKVGSATSVACQPLYKDLTHGWQRRDGEMYFEENFEGEFTFVGADFERIANADITTKFELYIYKKERPGEEYVQGTFMKTDGETDWDHKSFKTKITLNDMYKALVYGKSDERNLTKIKPKQGKMAFKLKPILQLYRPGADYMYQVTDQGNAARKEVVAESDVQMMRTAYGWWMEDHFYASINNRDIRGMYVQERPIESHPSLLNTYVLTLTGYKQYFVFEGVTTREPNGCVMRCLVTFDPTNTSVIRIEDVSVTRNGAGYGYSDYSQHPLVVSPCDNKEIRLAIYGGGEEQFYLYRETVMMRPLFSRNTPPAVPSPAYRKLSDDDPMRSGNGYNYTTTQTTLRNVLNVDLSVTQNEEEGIQLVKNNERWYYASNEYFLKRNTSVYNEAWGTLFNPLVAGYGAMAFQIGVDKTWLTSLREAGYTMLIDATKDNKDWYLLTSVIEKLAHWCDSTIHFEDNRSVGGVCDSLFLFGVYEGNPNRRTNVLNGDTWGRLMMLQKSNILQLNYDSAATNANITLEYVFELLKNAFNCWYELYWWHNPETGKDEKHLRIEHIQYFMNGHSYADDPRQVKNISALVDVRTGKPMSYRSNHYTYDEDRCANRIAFNWMDEQSEYFDGYQMKVPDEYNIWGNSKTEERPIEWFSSDVDYLMANPGQCAYEGFLIAQTAEWGSSVMNTYTYTDMSDGSNHTLQNGQMAMVYLQKKWMCYDIYSPKIRVNNEAAPYTDVVLTAKLRQNTMQFRLREGEEMSHEDIVMGMVKNGTIDARGYVESIKHELSSDWIEVTVNYDCEAPGGLNPGGSGVVPRVTTNYDDNEVMGYISRDGQQTMDAMVMEFGSTIVDHIADMEERNKVVVADNVVTVNESQWAYSREDVIDYLRGDGDKTLDGMRAHFGNGIDDYLDYLKKSGTVSENEGLWWATYTMDELITYLADMETETTSKLKDLFGAYVEDTLNALSPDNYCWQVEAGTWKSSYLGVEFTSETEVAIIELLSATGGATMQTVADDVAEGNVKVENLLDCMVWNGILIKEEELYKIA